jgi:esterase/lipase superfamily enzyme
VAEHQQAVAMLQDKIHRRLAKAPRKEVVIFTHGYDDTFADAAFATGNILRRDWRRLGSSAGNTLWRSRNTPLI